MVLAHDIDEGTRTQDIKIFQDVTFDTMLLAPNTLQGLKKSGFYKPSPVQLHGIPLGKCGFDLLLEAKSGTGKTAVFSVIALEKLDLDNGLQAVILAPTREIASQICDVIKQIGVKFPGLIVEVVMGGLPVAEDVEKFKRNVHIVVGSPGRLRHLIQDNHIDTSSVRLLVLDEADKLMEKSFLPDINYIFSILPKDKQVIMSSATYPEATKTFINKYVKCAQHVCPDSNCILLGVEQKITVVKSNSNIVRQTQYRFKELLKILSKKQFKQCLIFCNYQARVHELYKLLNKEKWPVEQLCGQQGQTDRLDALKTLQEYRCRILISTDLAARGIDASNVDLVINFEPPFEWQTYLHRIGRAGRYGSYGTSVTILSENKEEERFKKLIEAININTLKISQFWTDVKPVENASEIPEACRETPANVVIVEHELDCTEFWESLNMNVNAERKIDDFESLCESFHNSKKSQIESFTDLMDSYKTSNDKGLANESIYRNLDIKPILVQYVSQALKSNDINLNPDNLKVKEKVTKDKNDNLVAAVSNNIVLNKKSYANNENMDLNLEIHSINDVKNSKLHENYYDNVDAEPSSRALLDAGLPLCFGRSNTRNYFVSNENRSKDFQKSHKKKYKENIRNKKDKNNCQYSSHQQNTNEIYHKIRDNVHNKVKYQNKKSQTSYSRQKAREDACNENYINWYNQLKMRVNQIELAFYIEELSRI